VTTVYSHFGLKSRDAAPDTGILLPVSTMAALPGSWKWITIPFDVDYEDPENQHVVNGWTVLYGPARYLAVGEVRLLRQQDNASSHIRLWHAQVINGVDTRIAAKGPSWEWFVGPNEHGNTHVNGVWMGFLPAGQRLRMEVDYWNASAPARIVGAGINITAER